MVEVKDSLGIVITGASSGIGEAVALEMAKDSHRFYLTARRREKLEQVAQKVESLGGKAYYGEGDVRDEGDVDHLFDEAMERLGGRLEHVFEQEQGCTARLVAPLELEACDKGVC